jgi:hypothetical protein
MCLLTTLVASGVLFLAYQSRGEVPGADIVGSLVGVVAKTDFSWPPRLNEPYPDLQLIDQEGNTTRLSEFRGKICRFPIQHLTTFSAWERSIT